MAVYQEAHKKYLIILSASRGEDDALTEFIAGPGLSIVHRLWSGKKVCQVLHLWLIYNADRWQKPSYVDTESNTAGDSTDVSHVWYYSSKTLQRIATAIIMVVSSLVPLTSIIILSFVGNLAKRLGIVCGFTLGFSLILTFSTSARRIEIFAATAA